MASECLPIIFDPDLSFPAENGVRLPRFLAVTPGPCTYVRCSRVGLVELRSSWLYG